jgi:thiamine pyrophosphate-dependent acetolactate synthase large subunit-like protein
MYTDRDVVGLVGDGEFLMTSFELFAAVQYRAKPKVIVFNDSVYEFSAFMRKLGLELLTTN